MTEEDLREMQGLDELFAYKNQMMEDLLSSKEVLKLLASDGRATDDPKSLIYKQVHPYECVPEPTEEATTFLCCEVDIDLVPSKTLLYPMIYVWVFCHSSLLHYPQGGLRIDRLSSEIVRLLNRSRMYGMGALNLHSATRFSPIQQYQGRLLKFYAKDYNHISPSRQKVPVSRKRWAVD